MIAVGATRQTLVVWETERELSKNQKFGNRKIDAAN